MKKIGTEALKAVGWASCWMEVEPTGNRVLPLVLLLMEGKKCKLWLSRWQAGASSIAGSECCFVGGHGW